MKASTVEARRLATAAQRLAAYAGQVAWREHCDKGRDEAAGIAETRDAKKFVESCRRFVSFKRCTLLG